MGVLSTHGIEKFYLISLIEYLELVLGELCYSPICWKQKSMDCQSNSTLDHEENCLDGQVHEQVHFCLAYFPCCMVLARMGRL